jgi:NAD+--dinitrogen-reductase ADP-D-ribosyltransferase
MTKAAMTCLVDDNPSTHERWPRLPKTARLPINRCNLPPLVLGSLSFQHHPIPLHLDGVAQVHVRFFRLLHTIKDSEKRARQFMDYMTVYFRLESLAEMGLSNHGKGRLRGRADYLRMMRGWAFDPDYREGAVLKGWVESRFGLLARYHGGSLQNPSSDTYLRYVETRSKGLYNTNALEAQLDLLYTYCQYELHRQFPQQTHLTLYRGFNRLGDDEVLSKHGRQRRIVLLNNLSSFTSSWERADEFGDHMLRTQVPLSKVFFYNHMLPELLKGEDEYVVIGGLYEIERLS